MPSLLRKLEESIYYWAEGTSSGIIGGRWLDPESHLQDQGGDGVGGIDVALS